MASVYVASPYGFSPAGEEFLAARLYPALEIAGFEVLDPWAPGAAILGRVPAGAEHDDERRSACREVGATNAAMIRRADAVIAVLDGCDLDSGTSAEVGYAAALETPVVGLRMDMRACGDVPPMRVNLQVEYFLYESGGELVLHPPGAPIAETLVRTIDAVRGAVAGVHGGTEGGGRTPPPP